MSEDDPTGGLTLDPPTVDHEATAGIGFAPDLSDAHAPFFDEAPPHSDVTSRYPRAMAVLALLLPDLAQKVGATPTAHAPATTSTRAAASSLVTQGGPAITRPPAPFVRPKDRTATKERTEAKPGSEALMEMLLVGKNDTGAREAHFQFQEDVLGGMYLHLERRTEGLFLRFTVGDDGDRRTLAAYVDELVARFEKKGTRVVGYEIVVGGGDAR